MSTATSSATRPRPRAAAPVGRQPQRRARCSAATSRATPSIDRQSARFGVTSRSSTTSPRYVAQRARRPARPSRGCRCPRGRRRCPARRPSRPCPPTRRRGSAAALRDRRPPLSDPPASTNGTRSPTVHVRSRRSPTRPADRSPQSTVASLQPVGVRVRLELVAPAPTTTRSQLGADRSIASTSMPAIVSRWASSSSGRSIVDVLAQPAQRNALSCETAPGSAGRCRRTGGCRRCRT